MPGESRGTYQCVGGWEMMQWPPFDIEEVTYINYVIDADIGALRHLCDQFFNQPSGGAVRFEPLIPQIICSYANIKKATSSDPRAGTTTERDVMFWTPVVELTPDRTRVVAVPVFCPFVFVDNATAVSMGREMFGFPKNWCVYTSEPDGPSSKLPLAISAYTKPADEPTLAIRPLMKLSCTGEPKEPVWVHDTVEALEEIGKILKTFVTNENGLGPVLDAEALLVAGASLIEKRQPFVFLKQFPSMSDPGRCCYQAIGMLESKIGSISRFGIMPNDYELEVIDDTFHHFREAFGWPKSGPLPVRMAVYMDFSFSLTRAQTIWEAP